MYALKQLFENNRRWAERIITVDPEFFMLLSKQQNPKYLWIGCSDSRVPANEIVGLMPGELFVHRNVANLVLHTDFNCLSVIEYAVEVLKVEHIIVCGHYGCGGVLAALENNNHSLVDNWLRNVQDVNRKHLLYLNSLPDKAQKVRKLCELNIIEQVINVCYTTIVQKAWLKGTKLTIHGWVYGINNGLLIDLGTTISNMGEMPAIYSRAVEQIKSE